MFVTGGPGCGKTALLSQFARQAMEARADMLVASGSCSALAGIGDAHQPFREIVAMLTGDLEARWYAGSISQEHARRLWNALPRTAQALLEHGPNVIGTLVRGPALLSRATAAMGSQDGAWLHRLGDGRFLAVRCFGRGGYRLAGGCSRSRARRDGPPAIGAGALAPRSARRSGTATGGGA